MDDGGPAFPQNETNNRNTIGDEYGQGGMSLRDWFAGQALAGIMADYNLGDTFDDVARTSYELADAMLKARAAQQAGGCDGDC